MLIDLDIEEYTEAENQKACSKIWNVYGLEAERYDKALVESWKADMNGMLIFVRHHSSSYIIYHI